MSEIPYMLENTPEEFRRVRDLAWPAPVPARYAQCDETCTVDCGHCKGAGHPAPVAAEGTDELREAVAEALARHEPQWHDGFLTGEPDFFSCGADDESGSGCEWVSDPESTDWANQHHLHVADALLAGPLAPLLAKVQAVEALAAEWEVKAEGHADAVARYVDRNAAASLRRALGGDRG